MVDVFADWPAIERLLPKSRIGIDPNRVRHPPRLRFPVVGLLDRLSQADLGFSMAPGCHLR
jgi:hypothetical protein